MPYRGTWDVNMTCITDWHNARLANGLRSIAPHWAPLRAAAQSQPRLPHYCTGGVRGAARECASTIAMLGSACRRQPRTMPLLRAAFLVLCFACVRAELLQVQIVHRHGAREHLQKDAQTPAKEAGAVLLKEGEAQMEALGEKVRDRYVAGGSELSFEVDITPRDVRAVSSNLDRTLESSTAFLRGLFPDERVTPPKVFSDEAHDWRLRGYTLCPAFEEKVTEFLKSKEFKKMEADSADFLTPLAKDIGESPALNNVFNVYDRYMLASGDYDNAGAGVEDVKKISDDELAKLKVLADFVETNKYDSDTAGRRVGGGLVYEMLARANEAVEKYVNDTGSKVTAHRIIEYSAHYPTLLGVMAALASDGHLKQLDTIPSFSAAIIWELHRIDNKNYIKMLWYDGDSKSDFVLFDLGRAPCLDAKNGCALNDIWRLEAGDTYKTSGVFCQACDTSDQTTALCKATTAGSSSSGTTENPLGVESESGDASRASSKCSSRTRLLTSGIGALCGLVVGLLIGLAIMLIQSRRKRREIEFATSPDTDESPYHAGPDLPKLLPRGSTAAYIPPNPDSSAA